MRAGECPSRRSIRPALAGRRLFQIFDDHRLLAALADHGERVARRAASRIVIDRDRHSLAAAFSGSEASASSRKSQFISASAQTAPSNWAAINAGASIGRMPEKVLVSERAIATAGLANDV